MHAGSVNQSGFSVNATLSAEQLAALEAAQASSGNPFRIEMDYKGALPQAHYERTEDWQISASRCAVLRLGDEIVGSVFFAPFGSLEISGIYVATDFRRRKLGTLLVEVACKAMGIAPADVHPSGWYSPEGRALAKALGMPTEKQPKRYDVRMWRNLTPHGVRLRRMGAEMNEATRQAILSAEPIPGDIVIPPERLMARVASSRLNAGEAGGVPVIVSQRGDVQGLPLPVPGVGIIVSLIVLDALRASGSERRDVFAPATGPDEGAIRDVAGQIFAVTQLVAVGMP